MANRILEEIKKMGEAELKELAAILAPHLPQQVRTSAVRDSGKYVRTDKKLETRLARQMEVLINSLPADQPLSITEWAKCAVKKGLQTQQLPERIVTYYKKQLVEMGYVKSV